MCRHGVGYDYIHNDANGGNMRLDVRSQVKYVLPLRSLELSHSLLLVLVSYTYTQPHRNFDGTILAMFYKGTVALTPGVKAILSGSPDAKTTEFGDSFVNFSWETGTEGYKELENGTYVASGRFVVEGGKVVVEYKVSRVAV